MEIHKQGVCKCMRWNLKWLVAWCKRKRRSILICGAIILVAGLATQRLLLYKSPTLVDICSFPTEVEDANLRHVDISTTISTPSTSAIVVQPNDFITDKDRIALEHCLQSDTNTSWGWHEILKEERNTFDYILMGRKPKDGGPMQYLSTTRYKFIEDTNVVKNFITDNDYKKEWDKSFLEIKQLELDTNTRIEVLHIIKKYPIIGEREYILASKLWEKKEDKSFFCVTKAYNSEKAPNPTFTRVTNYLSGWRISKAPKGGCEMKLFHQEDIKSWTADHMKNLFKSKIIEYVEESESHLRDYIQKKRKPKGEPNAASLAQTF